MKANHPRTYRSWSECRQRCENPNNRKWPSYGGRGIKVCARWASFANFLADMGERPDGHSLDRINNDGDYEPNNCRWATPSEQARNRRSSHTLTAFGETLTIAEWAERTGLKHHTIAWRINKLGWTAERALSTPLRYRSRPSSLAA